MPGHQPKSEECDSCGWATEELTECDAYARTKGHGPFTPDDQKEWAWLCEVCRSSYAGNAYLYPRNYDDDIVLRTIAWQTNAILAAIEGQTEAVTAAIVKSQEIIVQRVRAR